MSIRSEAVARGPMQEFLDWLGKVTDIKFIYNEETLLNFFMNVPLPQSWLDIKSELTQKSILIETGSNVDLRLGQRSKKKEKSVQEILDERGARYGDFSDHARLCQQLKYVMTNFSLNDPTSETPFADRPWNKLSLVQKQALEVIADKIARILSGDPNYDDNWIDIQGYAKLVQDRLPKKGE